MEGKNRADKIGFAIQKSFRSVLESIEAKDVPCIFISYQREDERYAKDVAEYIQSMQIDVYFDLDDTDLKFYRQSNSPYGVTSSIQKGLDESNYVIVIVSPSTYKSLWVPFEIGYAFHKGDNMKILRHRQMDKNNMPHYLKVKELINGTLSLNNFLNSIRLKFRLYENLLEKGEQVKTSSNHQNNPLNKYLDNE